MNTTFVNKIIKSIINHNKEVKDIDQMINETTKKINKIKLTEEEKQYVTKKYSDYVNIIKHSINENDSEQKVSHKKKFIKNVVDILVGESKLLWKPTQLIFHRDNGWNDVRVSVPFNNQSTTPAQYFKNEGTHQDLFKVGFENFVEDIYALSKGETYYVYNMYIKEMFTKISYFIRENMETSEELNEVKKRSSTEKIGYSEGFLNKVIQYIKRRYPTVVDVKIDKHPWFKGWKEFIHVYVNEDDGQPTDIVQHPLEWQIHMDLTNNFLEGLKQHIEIRVTNLNKDTKLRSSVRESINEAFRHFDDSIPKEDIKKFIDKLVKKMVNKTEINLYMEDYDPWTTHSPWFGNVITPNFSNDRRSKYNISWFIDERKHLDVIPTFASELINIYGFSTNGELKYFESEYLKKLKEKVKLLQIPLIEKRRKQKEEYNKRYNISESKKDAKKEEDEIQRAVQDLSRLHNFNTSVSELTRGIVDSSPQPLSSEIWDVLENTESNEIKKGDFDTVFRLAQRYGKSNPLKLIKKLKKGSYNPPIIVRYDDNYRLVAGNTRLCTAAALGMVPKVLIVDLNKPFPVENIQKNKNLL